MRSCTFLPDHLDLACTIIVSTSEEKLSENYRACLDREEISLYSGLPKSNFKANSLPANLLLHRLALGKFSSGINETEESCLRTCCACCAMTHFASAPFRPNTNTWGIIPLNTEWWFQQFTKLFIALGESLKEGLIECVECLTCMLHLENLKNRTHPLF